MAAKQEILTIRPFEVSDIEMILALYNEVMQQRGSIGSRATIRSGLTAEELTASEPGSELDLSFVADLGEKLVGFLWARVAHVGLPVKQVAVIHSLMVHPDHQRRGIAKQLIESLVRRCRPRGIDTIRAVVEERDWELQNFFSATGFHHSGLVIYSRPVT